jgi:hypothetical protein
MMQEQHSILDRMHGMVDAWDSSRDRRSIFLRCYALMTGNMLAAIQRDEFHDNDWVRTLLHHFAEYYFRALDAYDRGDPAVPAVWRVAHEAAAQHHAMTLQHLFLGVNAHINFDLALTVVDLLGDEWESMPQPYRRERHADYCAVNDIIASTIDAVQDDVLERYTPALGVVDAVFGRIDEWAISRVITRWREQVWENAVSLMELPTGTRRDDVIALLEAMALERSDAILFREGLASFKHLV